MTEPHPIPNYPTFNNLTGVLLPSGIQVVHFLGRKKWLAICPCGSEFTAGGLLLFKGETVRCPECRSPSIRTATKQCSECKRLLPFTEEYFWPSTINKAGLRPRCLQCVAENRRVACQQSVQRQRLKILTHYSGGTPRCECSREKISQREHWPVSRTHQAGIP